MEPFGKMRLGALTALYIIHCEYQTTKFVVSKLLGCFKTQTDVGTGDDGYLAVQINFPR